MIGRLCPKGSILDVGCGEAVLRDYLPHGVKYLGIEPSAEAIQLAHAKYGPDHIVRCTAEDFDAGECRWDCIVFIEVLYYATSPLALLNKYSNLVRPAGVIIVSIYQKRGNGIKAWLRRWVDHHSGTPNVQCTREFITQWHDMAGSSQRIPLSPDPGMGTGGFGLATRPGNKTRLRGAIASPRTTSLFRPMTTTSWFAELCRSAAPYFLSKTDRPLLSLA
jgi:SAM-dependent methyltransferase